jgi:hypothetical protein
VLSPVKGTSKAKSASDGMVYRMPEAARIGPLVRRHRRAISASGMDNTKAAPTETATIVMCCTRSERRWQVPPRTQDQLNHGFIGKDGTPWSR